MAVGYFLLGGLRGHEGICFLAWSQAQLSFRAAGGLTREWLELLPAEPWLLVSISAPASKCACAAARTLASQAMGEECPELSLPLRPRPALNWPLTGTGVSQRLLHE